MENVILDCRLTTPTICETALNDGFTNDVHRRLPIINDVLQRLKVASKLDTCIRSLLTKSEDKERYLTQSYDKTTTNVCSKQGSLRRQVMVT